MSRVLRLATSACGTRIECVLGDTPGARAAGEQALAEVELWDARLSRFRADSWLSHINRNAPHGAVRVEPELFDLLETCRRVWVASAGAFDPRRGASAGHMGAPQDQSPEALYLGTIELVPQRRTVRFTHPGDALDLGGIGKGFALARAAEVLAECEVERAFLHGGTSTAVALGNPPTRDGFGVELDGGGRVSLSDEAVSVSGSLANGPPSDERTSTPHVLDARSQRPATTHDLAVVRGADAALADAWSTALLVSGLNCQLPAGLRGAVRDARTGLWSTAGASPSPFDVAPNTRPNWPPARKHTRRT